MRVFYKYFFIAFAVSICATIAFAQTASSKASQGTSVATLATALPKTESPFGLGIWSYTNVGMKSVEDSNPDALQFARVTATYSLTESFAVGYFQELWYTFPTDDTQNSRGHDGHGNLDDGGLHLAHAQLAMLPFDIKLSLLYRQYFPTGETSRFVTHRMGAEQVLLTFSRSLGSFDFAESIYGTYFNQTQDYYYNSSRSLVANADFEIDQYLFIGWRLTDYFSLVNWIGSEHIWYRGVPLKGVNRSNSFYNETGFVLKPVKQFSLTATVLTDPQLESTNSVTLYRPQDTVYRLYATIAI